eukprot:scaffold900_cov72-Cylindrotheca_fusiformis.AAC.2
MLFIVPSNKGAPTEVLHCATISLTADTHEEKDVEITSCRSLDLPRRLVQFFVSIESSEKQVATKIGANGTYERVLKKGTLRNRLPQVTGMAWVQVTRSSKRYDSPTKVIDCHAYNSMFGGLAHHFPVSFDNFSAILSIGGQRKGRRPKEGEGGVPPGKSQELDNHATIILTQQQMMKHKPA